MNLWLERIIYCKLSAAFAGDRFWGTRPSDGVGVVGTRPWVGSVLRVYDAQNGSVSTT